MPSGGETGRMTPLGEPIAHPCRSLCRWRPSRARAGAGSGVFTCTGCGSQWMPGLAWTPIDADGTIPAKVLSAKRAATSGRSGAAADTSDR
jgi:hypothetical protein